MPGGCCSPGYRRGDSAGGVKCGRGQRLFRITIEEEHSVALMIGSKRYRGCPDAFYGSGRGLERQLEELRHEVHAIAAADGANILGGKEGWESGDIFGRRSSKLCVVRNKVLLAQQEQGDAAISKSLHKKPRNASEHVGSIPAAYKRLVDTIGEADAFQSLKKTAMGL